MFFIKKFIKSPDIILIISPPWDVMMPPLGLAYLSAYLRENGFHSLVFDLNIALYNSLTKEEKKLWRPEMYDFWFDEKKFINLSKSWRNYLDKFTKKILSYDTPFIGFSVNSSNRHFSLELARRIKSRNEKKTIIFGGPACFGMHLETFFLRDKELPPVDIFVIGEGEETLKEILTLYDKKRETIKGAIFKNSKGYTKLIPRQPIMNLDSIPFPTFQGFSLKDYLIPALPLIMSRGCISRCSFCNDHRMSYPYRWRSPEYVIKEIEYHIRYNHINGFSFKDLLCNGNIPLLHSLCDLLIEKKLNISWDSQAIPRKEMDYNLLHKMKEAGCHTLIYGVESCSDNILKRMRKMFTQETLKKVIKETHEAGIRVYINIIVGFPGESEEDFSETFNFIRENRKYIDSLASLSLCMVNGETDLEFYPEKYSLILPEDPKIRARYWQDISGNNYQLRRERAERLLSLLKELNLSYDCLNL